MTFFNEYVTMLKNYANFRGRTTVRGYWMAVLVNVIIAVVLSVLANLVDVLAILSGLYSLALMIPGLALCVRRLHDINKSGWYMFISLIPIVGGILLLVQLCKASVNEGNRFADAVTV